MALLIEPQSVGVKPLLLNHIMENIWSLHVMDMSPCNIEVVSLKFEPRQNHDACVLQQDT